MSGPDELGPGGLAALGAIGSVCAVLLRSTHQNLKTLDTLRREADAATEKLRQELRDHDETIFELQELCADYRVAIAKLEDENLLLRKALMDSTSHPETSTSNQSNPNRAVCKTRPEDVL
jgi:hypothetical protein